MTVTRIIMVAAGLISIVSGLLKIRAVRQQPNSPSVRALCLGLLAFGSAFLILAPPHTVIISEFIGIPNSGRLLGNILTLASAGAMQVMMLYLAHPPEAARPRARRRLMVLVGIALAMTLLLTTADTENETNFVERYATYTPITVYQILYLSFLAVAVVDLIHLSVRYSRHVDRMLKIGLRMVAVGGVMYAFHTAYKAVLIVAAWTHSTVPGDESTIASLLAALGGILIAAGTTLPVWGPRVARPWRWARRYRSYRQLEPLWRRLSAAIPDVALSAADRGGASRPWDIDMRLYRRVIEIRDAQLLLGPYSDQEAVAQAEADARRQGLAGDRAQAYVDATALFTALDRWRPDGTDAASSPSPKTTVGDASLSRESRYLEQVAANFTTLTLRQGQPHTTGDRG